MADDIVARVMRLNYAGGSLLTGDEIAVALLDYSAALARADTAISIDAPGMTPDGTPGRYRLLLGPASQMLAEPTDDPRQFSDEAFVTALRDAIAALPGPTRAVPIDDFHVKYDDDGWDRGAAEWDSDRSTGR